MVRGALLIALALALQSIRVFLPLPPQVNAYFIGTLVHMMLVLSLLLNGLPTALFLAVLLPLTAFVQGQVAFPVLVPVIMVGNIIFVLLVRKWQESKKGIVLPPLVKAICMCWFGWHALKFLNLHSVPAVRVMLAAFSMPQVVTGVLGILVARGVYKRLPKEYR